MILLSLAQLVPRSARAEAPALTWPGPACLDARAAFEARLAELVKPADAARLHGTVTVTPRSGGFDVQLSLALGARALGGRRFQARTCKAAAETAAVAAAMAAFADDPAPPAPVEAPPNTPPATAEPSTRKPEPEPDSSRERRRSARRPVRAQPRAGLLVFLQTGLLPSPALGGALELGVGLGRRWSLAVQGGVSGAQERAHGSERSTSLRAFLGAARGCLAPLAAPLAAPRVRLDVCGGVQLLWIRGAGEGFDVDREASLVTAAPLFALDLSLRVARFLEWRVQAEGSVPLSRQRFLVDGRELARVSALTFSARLGPVVRF